MRPAFPDPQMFLDRADKVAAWNRLQPFLGRQLPIAGGRAALTVTSSEPPPAGLPRTTLSAGGIHATIAFADFPFEPIVGIPLQATDLADLGAPLRDALLSGMVDTVAAALPEPFNDVRAVPHGAEPADMEWAVLTFEGFAPEPIRVFAGASRAAVATAFGDLGPDTAGRGHLMAATPVTADVTLLRIGVPRRRLAALKPGRFLVLARGAETRTALRIGGYVWTFDFTGEGWQVTAIGAAEAAPFAIDQEEGTVTDADEEAGPQSLTLPVDFDIGSTTVRLSDLDAWRVGSVVGFDLPRPGDGLAVTIKVAGTPVGTGDLVRIENRLAVRITALWGAKSA